MEDGNVMSQNAKTGAMTRFRNGHTGVVYHVSVDPQNSKIASCGQDNKILLWENKASAKFEEIRQAHSAPIRWVEFNKDGELLVSASDDKLVKLWRSYDRRFLQSFSGHTNWVKCAQFSGDSRMVLSGGDDKTVRLWDIDHPIRQKGG